MKQIKSRNGAFIAVFLTLLTVIMSAAAFFIASQSVCGGSTVTIDRTVVNTHSELWPWSTLNERDSVPVLELIDDPSVINEEVINSFVKRILISSSHSITPHSAIDAADFSDDIMITTDDFHIWMKDHTIEASNGEEFVTGFYGFTGEYNIAHSVYCIRKNALSKDGVWTEFTKDEIIAHLEDSGQTVIYTDTPEIESDVEYIRDYGEIYTMGYSLLDRAVDYIYGIMLNTGFESSIDEFLPDFDDAVSKLDFKSRRNGDLLVISFYDTIPFKLHVFYDLGTDTFCGWTRE